MKHVFKKKLSGFTPVNDEKTNVDNIMNRIAIDFLMIDYPYYTCLQDNIHYIAK
ncbi:hypothetical protein H3T52_07535 [Commensalibacter sp. M0402]|uniref:hypothetical protein n=1 Tax=Commensalibacter TaxID=1079922 RepID=UPI0018DC9989|nr:MULTISPECIES: hypothetical protein [Commensalibacter]MBI0083610.1 hypothetical protein [Commensalibacter sp. W6292M3]MBI0088795.1 hypothetical protein [Commensalibacter melissae]